MAKINIFTKKPKKPSNLNIASNLFRNKASNPEWSRSKRYTTHSGTRTTRSGMRQKCSGISYVPVLVGTYNADESGP